MHVSGGDTGAESDQIAYRYEWLPVPRFAHVDDGVTALTGYTPADHYADPDLAAKLVHPDDATLIPDLLLSERDPDGPLLLRWVTRDGRLIWTEHQIQLVRDQQGRVTAVDGLLRDVTREKALRGHDAALAEALSRSQEGVMVTDAVGTITYVNRAFAERSGYRVHELIGQNPRILKSGAHSVDFYQRMWKRLAGGLSFSGGFINRRKDGTLFREATIIAPFRDDAGRVTGFVAVKRDTTSESAAVEALALERAERHAAAGAMARIEADGDLAETARQICRQLVTVGDIRLAAVIAFQERGAVPLALELRDGQPWTMPRRLAANETTFLRQASAGGTWVQAVTPDQSLKIAGPAMERGITHFGGIGLRASDILPGVLVVGAHDSDPDVAGRVKLLLDELGPVASALLAEGLKRHTHWRNERRVVRRIIRGREFEPVFQPIVDIVRGSVVGYELLTRFADGMAPNRRFAAAYAVGLERQLELATLRRGLEAARSLPASRWLSLNISPELLARPTQLQPLLRNAGRGVILELTEHRAVADYKRVRAAVARLGSGVSLAVDDAGAGFASLRHILELRPAYVKLDHGLTHGVSDDSARQALVTGFRFFAQRVGCVPVAEGIETEADLATLIELGIPLGQGYLLGMPARVDEILEREAAQPAGSMAVAGASRRAAIGIAVHA